MRTRHGGQHRLPWRASTEALGWHDRLDDRFHESCHNGGDSSRIFGFPYRPREPTLERGKIMAAWRRAIELSLGHEDTAKLRSIAQSRTETASRVERARILLAYRENPSFYAGGRALGL